jgi:hypothetical protein
MSKLFWMGVVLIGVTRLAQAQGPAPARDLRRDAPAPVTQPPAAISPTPEMWFYEQERTRYEDPKDAVRRKAEARSTQRASRMASLKWYGMSNSRPAASTTPYFGSYAPHWSASGLDPNRWRAAAPTTVVVRPGNGLY